MFSREATIEWSNYCDFQERVMLAWVKVVAVEIKRRQTHRTTNGFDMRGEGKGKGLWLS